MNASGIIRTALTGVALAVGSLAALAAQLVVPAGATVTLPSGTLGLACSDLIVQGTMSVGASQVMQGGNVSINAAATLDGGAGTIRVGGNWANAGTFTRGTSLVAFQDGCTTTPAQLTGVTAFTNLSFTSAVGRIFVIPTGNAISVFGELTLAGAAGSPIQIVSANSSQPTSIVLGPSATVSSTDVQLGTNVALDGTAIARLANISTRMQVLTGNDVMIAGFIIDGSTAKTVVINVAGPNLANFGIVNPLANPMLTLVRSSDQAVLKTNDNWQTQTIPGDVAAIQATGFQPNNSAEPAIIATLAPGAYTAIVQGAGGATGVGLVGVFEVDHFEVPLINISTRGQVLTGNDVMIAGFIIQGSGSQTVVVNVAGPHLANFGIVNPLANPTLTLVRSSDNAVIATNDDWQSAANAAQIQASGFQPNNPLEPAIMMTLAPGAYTAIVQGVGGGTGVALVGVFTTP